MKIFNKAFNGFNMFLFVCDNGVHIGCSCFKSSTFDRDCLISPLITPNINWELFESELLYRNNSSNFYEYYEGIISMINTIRDCFDYIPDEQYPVTSCDNEYDFDPTDEISKILDKPQFYSKYDEHPKKSCSHFDETSYDTELEWCFNELDFIKTSCVNPLEMLYEAEKALVESYKTQQQYASSTDIVMPVSNRSSTDGNLELLDDPIALMKKLKNERGIQAH